MSRRSERLPAVMLFCDEELDSAIWSAYSVKQTRASKADFVRSLIRLGFMVKSGRIRSADAQRVAAQDLDHGQAAPVAVEPRRRREPKVKTVPSIAPAGVVRAEGVNSIDQPAEGSNKKTQALFRGLGGGRTSAQTE